MPISTVQQSDFLDTWRITLNETIGRWNILGESSDITITGGNIDGTAIGGATPSTASFTSTTVSSTLDIRGATLLIDADSISGNTINGGTAQVDSLILNNSITLNNQATTKNYVDTAINTVGDDAVALAIALG